MPKIKFLSKETVRQKKDAAHASIKQKAVAIAESDSESEGDLSEHSLSAEETTVPQSTEDSAQTKVTLVSFCLLEQD